MHALHAWRIRPCERESTFLIVAARFVFRASMPYAADPPCVAKCILNSSL